MWRRSSALVLVLALLVLSACHGGGKKPAKVNKKSHSRSAEVAGSQFEQKKSESTAGVSTPPAATTAAPLQVVAPPQAAAAGARVVVDTSGSMKGFVQKGRVTLQTIHRSIDELLSSHGLNVPLERCLLGKEFDCTKSLPYTEYQSTKIYDAEVSRLDLALVRPVKAPGENPAAPPPRDNLDPFRISILLTDGMQAAQGSAGAIVAGTPTASAVACASGADPGCLGALLVERAREGYGIWVISLSLPFDGQHYAERGLDAGHWQQVNAHIDELKKAPEWYGTPLEVSKLSTNKKTGTSSYQYMGVKPLLFFVFSREHATARTFVIDLANRLQAERIGAPEGHSVQWTELSPLGKRLHAVSGVELVEGKKPSKLRLSRLRRTDAGAEVTVTCPSSREGKPNAALAISLSASDVAPGLPAYVQQRVQLEPGARGVSNKILKDPSEKSAGNYVAKVDCTFVSAGQYQAEYILSVEQQMSEVVPDSEWWIGLSAENTYEQPERVYGLKPLVLRVLRQALADQRHDDTLTIRIEKKP